MSMHSVRWCVCFFFQAEDGIRDVAVTGVQTCALPIYRESYADFDRVYTVPVEGGPAEVLPMWRGEAAWFSPDGGSIASVPNEIWQTSWKRYRGGQSTPIYIVRLSDLALEKVSREDSNDKHPVWFGDTVYFLSDRSGPVTLFAYERKTRTVKQVIDNKGLDFKS